MATGNGDLQKGTLAAELSLAAGTGADTPSAAAPAAAHGLSPVDLFLQADTVVKTVMILLVLASAWGWAGWNGMRAWRQSSQARAKDEIGQPRI